MRVLRALFAIGLIGGTTNILMVSAIPADPPKPQPVSTPTYKVVLIILVYGTDGTLSAERELVLPFVPQKGIDIDLFHVENVSWATRRQAFVVRLEKLEAHENDTARNALKLFSGGDEWKETFFSPKREDKK